MTNSAISYKRQLLTQWNEIYDALYGDNDHDIPPAEELNITEAVSI